MNKRQVMAKEFRAMVAKFIKRHGIKRGKLTFIIEHGTTRIRKEAAL